MEKKTMPNYMKYVTGGLAGMMAVTVVQPVDLIKTRLQLSSGLKEYSGTLDCIAKVFEKEGLIGFYSGLSAALLRQATYTTMRMGVYQMEVDSFRTNYKKEPPVWASMAMALCAGGIGAIVGTPADVSLIRMMADKRLPPEQRRNYKNVADSLIRIVREEGTVALWRGCTPTVARAMVVNMAQLASYSQFKLALKPYVGDGLSLHILASMLSGVLTCTASLPLDMAKTRIQQMKTVDGKREYSGTLDVLHKVVKNDGVLALWKGYGPYLARIWPHTVFSFIFLEQLTKAYYHIVLGQDKTDGGI